MDPQRFDDLTRSLSFSMSRRRVLLGLLIGAPAIFRRGSVEAARSLRRDGETCRTGSECTGGLCKIGADRRRRCASPICVPNADPTCTDSRDACPGGDLDCYCRTSVENDIFCGRSTDCGQTFGFCQTSADCGPDEACTSSSCCGRYDVPFLTCCPDTGGYCVPRCGPSLPI